MSPKILRLFFSQIHVQKIHNNQNVSFPFLSGNLRLRASNVNGVYITRYSIEGTIYN